MDFFASEERARRRSRWLDWMFTAAVVLLVVAVNVFASVVMWLLTPSPVDRHLTPAEKIMEEYYAAHEPPHPPTGITPEYAAQVHAGLTFGTLLLILIGSAFKFAELSAGGSAVALQLGGRQLDGRGADLPERRLLNLVEEMAIAAGIAVPGVYVLEDPAINALAAGHGARDAAIVVTRGAMQRLTRDELQGVIAHEFSLLVNGDMALNLRVVGLLTGILGIAQTGFGLMSFVNDASVDQVSGPGETGRSWAVLVLFMPVWIAGALFTMVGGGGWLMAGLIRAALGRERDVLADATAVQFTRNPGGVSGALAKCGPWYCESRVRGMYAAEYDHLFFAGSAGWTRFLAVHPSVESRIRAIDPGWDGEFRRSAAVVDAGWEAAAAAPGGAAVPALMKAMAEANRAAAQTMVTVSDGGTGAGGNGVGAAVPVMTAPAAVVPAAAAEAPAAVTKEEKNVPTGAVAATVGTAAVAGGEDAVLEDAIFAGPRGVDLVPAHRAPVSPEHVAWSAGILARLPVGIDAAARDPDAARAVVLALALAPEALVAAAQQAAVAAADADLGRELAQLAPAVQALGATARLPLLSLSIAALKRLSARQRAEFITLLAQVAHQGGSWTLAAYSLVRLVSVHLAPRAKSRATLASLEPLRGSLQVVLSDLAREGNEPLEVTVAFAAGWAALDLGAAPAPLPPGAVDAAAIDSALAKLDRADSGLKRRIVAACAACIAADGAVTAREAELLRMVADCLGCPLPPLVADASWAGSV